MARVERGNVVLHIDDEDIKHYLTLGYKQTDDNGNVIAEGIPNSIGELQKAYVEHEKKIAELEAKVKELTAPKSTKSKKQ